jgi:hypothetical protein
MHYQIFAILFMHMLCYYKKRHYSYLIILILCNNLMLINSDAYLITNYPNYYDKHRFAHPILMHLYNPSMLM